MMRMFLLLSLTGLLCSVGCTSGKPDPVQAPASFSAIDTNSVTWPGRAKDGSVLLPNQWSLRPAGRQVELADFPINIAVHPGGRFAAILHSGYSEHQIQVVDIPAGRVVSSTPLKQAFYGMEFSSDGTKLFCSGSSDEVVHEFEFRDGTLTEKPALQLRPATQRGVPAGLTLDKSAKHLYVANVWGDRVTQVTLGAQPHVSELHLGTNLAALTGPSIKPSADFDTAAAEKRAEALQQQVNPEDTFPYTCRLDERRQRLYVSLWAQASVAVIDLASARVVARWPTEEHPCEMALTRSGRHLFVANASRNTVTVFETDSGKPIETIWAALYPNVPPGSTPNSLALSPDEQTLFIANADNNMVAVVDVSRPGKSRSLGFIPAGWYPTSVRVTPDGTKLLIANGKGLTSKANPLGPQPRLDSTNRTPQYIAKLFKGSLGIIDLPARKEFERQLASYTAQTYQCSPLRPKLDPVATRASDNPIPARPGAPSPLKYCIYIIKENRTYDQVLGDMREGNGDPALCLFPEHVTPNMHKLAREFVLLDNFYVESEVSADGHEWSMGAYATDFVEKMWPLSYGHNSSGKFPYPSEGTFPIASPSEGYIWDRAKEAGVSYRSYGEFIANGSSPEKPGRAKVKSLQGHFDEWYRSFDMGYSDIKRAERFISELKRFEGEGAMPQLQIVRLPNDHTHGTTIGFRSPTAYVAENDVALGMLVEAVSRSKFWPETAIFVVEDDAQNGPDHVDAHRTTAFVVSPYTRRGFVDSSLYSTSSMLRTMELLLGLKPMSQFDASARPMYNSFQAAVDLRPYDALPTNVNLDERNEKQAWGGNLKMNFAREDAVDDLLLNEAIWRSVRGPNSPMPAPVRAGFVFPHAPGVEED